MAYLKLMSADDKPDTDAFKGFTIISLNDTAVVSFDRSSKDHEESRFSAYISYNGDGVNGELPLKGNAYLMSDTGKTVASHGC